MKEKTDKLLTLVMLGLAVVASVFAIVFALNTDKFAGLYNIAYWMLLLLVICSIAAIVIFAGKKLGDNFKTQKGYAKKFCIILGAAVVVLLASFLLAKGTDVSAVLLEKNGLTESSSRLIGAACILVYILVIAAACSIVYVEVAKLSKKK